MFSVGREIHFSYGHRIMGHSGKCAHLHGHNGKILVEISSHELDRLNMVIDFAQIRDSIGEWIKDTLDHRMILWTKDSLSRTLADAGEPVVLMEENPTAEAIARWVYQEARQRGLAVSKVTLWETANSCAVYHE